MSAKFKQEGLTEQEVINLPKVNCNSIFIGETDVFLKKKKNDIINLGSKELFRDIRNLFNFDTATNIMLFLALCGHEEVTTFKGDPYKKLEELVRGSHKNIRNSHWEEYLKLDRESRKSCGYYNKYSSASRITTSTKAWLEKEIEELENEENLSDWEKERLDKYKEEVKTLNNDILDIFSKANLYLIGANIDVNTELGYPGYYKEFSTEYYLRLGDNIWRQASHMHPYNSNDSNFGLRVKHIRDMNSVSGEWLLTKGSYINTKTGELKAYLSNSISRREISLNIYKDDIRELEFKENINLKVIINVILKSYRKSNLTESALFSIIQKTLRNESYSMSRAGYTDGSSYSSIKIGNNHYTIYRDNTRVKGIKTVKLEEHNYLEVVALIVKNIDKINNSPTHEMFNTFSSLFIIPKGSKWKIHTAFGLNKQVYNKLTELNRFEQNNYLTFSKRLEKSFNHLYNEINLNKLFDDTFLMVQHPSSVSIALEFGEHVNNTINITFADFKKMVHYLDVDAQDRQRITYYGLSNIYKDYINDLASLVGAGYRTERSVNLTPFSLKLEHDIVTDEKQAIQSELDDKELKNRYQDKLTSIINKTYKLADGRKVKFLPADSVSKLKEEGKMLSHCVGGYANRIIKNNCLILLARLEEDLDNSWYTVEIRITQNGYVLGQQQSIDTYKLPNELKVELEKDIKKINRKEFKEAS